VKQQTDIKQFAVEKFFERTARWRFFQLIGQWKKERNARDRDELHLKSMKDQRILPAKQKFKAKAQI